MISRNLRTFWEKIEIETYMIQSNQSKNKQNYSSKFKLKNSLLGTSQNSKIGHLGSILQCIKESYSSFYSPGSEELHARYVTCEIRHI